jgi:subtilisin family serine protease
MRSVTIERRSHAGRRTRRILRALPAGATIVALGVVPSTIGPAGLASATTDQAVAAPTVGTTLVGTHRITLITGDVVILTVTADGRQSAWVADPVDTRAPAQVYEVDGEVHVVPAEAAPYVASGAVDDSLFDVTMLARDGFDDAATSELPLLVEASDRARASAMPAPPEGSDEVRELDSVNTVSVTADKDDIRTVWESLTGSSPAPTTSTDAQLAGDKTVWLNGRVEATLDESVAQIGAPDAWALGYDGEGTQVAVLDTGYDATHPDLEDRVVAARNFTEVPDPSGAVAVDGNGHGTHVAATVGGSGAASDGQHRGVAPGADLIVGKVLDNEGSGSTDQIIAGMEWAVEQGADVVNMSLGTDFPSDGTDPMSQAVNQLTQSSGTLFVVAAGNSGPGAQTIGSPGAADLALTVGAVTKDDQPAAFSSRGPRLGDGAIKPEITAPGADIVAARAAGTSLGNLLDEYYTSLNGTSMATPHVAGAAAILAQEHPDWTAAALKSRLVSTSRTMPDQPVTFQGGGRVDVAAAVRQSVSVEDGTLFLGQVDGQSDPVVRQLTYRNDTERPMMLNLTVDVTSTGSDGSRRPELRIGQSVVSVPAGGSATVPVTLLPRSTQSGSYAGHIVARPAGSPQAPVHTTVSFTVTGPMRTLTIEAVDRAGQPASGPVDLWSAETGDLQRSFLQNGVTTFEVPEGLYSLVAGVEMAGSWFSSVQHTIAAEPELRITGDRTLRFDARDAQPLRVVTPRPTDLDIYDVIWHRKVGERSASEIISQGIEGERIFVLGSESARTGSFTLASEWQQAQPLLSASVVGSKASDVTTSQIASPAPTWFVGQERLPLVDAGAGTSESFAGVDVDGAAALVSRGTQAGSLRTQATAAAAAGADMLLAYNTSVSEWRESASNATIPVYRLEHEDGQALLDALASRSNVEVDFSGVRDATYQYELAYTAKGRIPDGRTYRVEPDSLATVTSDYRQNSSRQVRAEAWIPYLDGVGVANSMSQQRSQPLVRTDYVNTDGVEWQRFGQPHQFLGYYWTSTAPIDYRAGRDYHRLWWGPLVHPAVPPSPAGAASAPLLGNGYRPVARYRDAIRINLPHYSFGSGLTSTIYEVFGDRSRLTLERDGQVLGTSTWPNVQWTVPADEATYDLTLDVVNGSGNWSDTSVSTQTTWRFESARTDESGEVLPLLQVDYELDTDAFNAVPSGQGYPLVLRPGYQPQADGPGRFEAEVEVSFDDGATWQPAPVSAADGSLRAQVPAATGPGFASVRVVVTDADGNQISQRIDRAWKIAGP